MKPSLRRQARHAGLTAIFILISACSPAYKRIDTCTSGSLQNGIRIHFLDKFGRPISRRVLDVSVSGLMDRVWGADGHADVTVLEYGKSPPGLTTTTGPEPLEPEVAYEWSVLTDGGWWQKDNLGGAVIYRKTIEEFESTCPRGAPQEP